MSPFTEPRTSEPRDQALERLYEAEIRGGPADTSGLSRKARASVECVEAHRSELDDAIGAVAKGWTIGRMPPIDRTILRMGLCELRHTDLPPAVVISEAVRMAKLYSTEKSGSFINGVLGELATAGNAK